MEKQFSEDELRQVIKIATQENQKESGDYRLSIDEVKTIGTELGIPLKEIESAVIRVSERRLVPEESIENTNNEILTESWVPGNLSRSEIENIFVELESNLGVNSFIFGRDSNLKELGNTLEYQFPETRVSITNYPNEHLIRVTKVQFFNGSIMEAAILAFPVSLIVGIVPVSLSVEYLSLFWTILFSGASYVSAFYYMKNYTRRKRRELRSSLNSITNTVKNLSSMMLKDSNSKDGG